MSKNNHYNSNHYHYHHNHHHNNDDNNNNNNNTNNNRQLLDEVFVISRIIKVEVGVISWSRRLRLITLLFIIQSMKNKMVLVLSYFFDVLLGQQSKPISHIFASSRTANNIKCAYLTWLPLEIMYCGHIWHDYPWPWVTLTWLLYNLQVLMSQALISKIHCRLSANQKRVTELNV